MKTVAQPVCRVPFGLREKVVKELNQPLELSIIEEVTDGLSGWISPLVVVPKGKGLVKKYMGEVGRSREGLVHQFLNPW